MRSLAAIFLGSVLCACSALSPDASALTQQRSKQPPRNYRQIIVDGSVNFNPSAATTEVIAKQRQLTEVSALRETRGPQLGDWVACLRIPQASGMAYVAIFFEDEKILDYRTAVKMDRCEGETYGSLPPRSPSPNKEK